MNKDKMQDEFMDFWHKTDNVGLGSYSDSVTDWWFEKIESILKLKQEEMRGAFNRMFADLVQENKSNDIKIPESYAYIYDLLNRSQQNKLLDK